MAEETLHYPPISPATLPINRFLFRLREREFLQRFLTDPDALFATLDLTDAQRQAAVDRDMARLVALGAHPMLATLIRIAPDLELHPEKFQFY